MKKQISKKDINKLSKNYFTHLAKSYPVMCLSDEFYFFPRATEAIDYLDRLDSLDLANIKQSILHIKKLLYKLESIKTNNLETNIDLALLRCSMWSFIQEFEHNKIHKKDPTLYLKIILFGIEHIINNINLPKKDKQTLLISRVNQIPRLLNEAKKNLERISPLYIETANEIIDPSIAYFKKTMNNILKDKSLIEKAISSLQDYKNTIRQKGKQISLTKDKNLIENILKYSFSYKKSLSEIYEIALKEYNDILEKMSSCAKKIDSRKNWQEILSNYTIDTKNIIKLYSNEIDKLSKFFKRKNVFSIPKTNKIIVEETPDFISPIRASASYSCPITCDLREYAFFYLTTDISINNEYIFLTAHETYPGHHLLDSVRKRLKNPIRTQIESALFYEGWSSYAESLISELGYTKDLMQKLVGLKRQAWRAVRAILDSGLRIGKIKIEDVETMLKDLGYSPKAVKQMIRHYILTPGYQLCYTIGKYEIDKLRKKFAHRLGLKKFHDILLNGGEIPFDLIEKRMDKACRKNS